MHKQENLGQGVLTNAIANGILQFLNYAFPVLTLPFLGSVIGVEEFGVVNFFSVLVGYFTLFVIYGFDASATRKVPELEDDLKKNESFFCGDPIVESFIIDTGFYCFFTSSFNYPTGYR